VAVTVAPDLARRDTLLEGVPEGELEKSLQAHLTRIMPAITWKAVVAGAKAHRNILFLALVAGLVCFAFNLSFTMPKTIEIPIIGGFLQGKTLDRQTLAFWLPAAALILQAFAVGQVVRVNLTSESLRNLILELVVARGWTLERLSQAYEKHALL